MARSNSFFKKFWERFIEGLLTLSGAITSITVLLIVFFLFKEGVLVLGREPVEDEISIVVRSENPINELSAEQILSIFDKKVTNWNQLGSNWDKPIHRKRAGDFKEEDLGKDLDSLPYLIAQFMNETEGGIGAFPTPFLPSQQQMGTAKLKIVKVDKITLGSLLKGRDWYPTATPAPVFGFLPLILGTIWVSVGAIAFALPLALATSIFMAEIASPGVRRFMKPVVELLAGIPSVVYGFFGLTVLVPIIKDVFGLAGGETALAGSIILGIMALPTIITISEDAIRNTPRALKEASLALGATHWQTIRKVVLPFSSSGIAAAVVLGIGRAIGETMSVLMVTGNSGIIPTSYLKPLRTIPATIAQELGEAPYGGLHYKILFGLGCVLFIMTFSINLIFYFIAKKRKA